MLPSPRAEAGIFEFWQKPLASTLAPAAYLDADDHADRKALQDAAETFVSDALETAGP
jgi:hypothetical protein